jgi:hypothetical protein
MAETEMGVPLVDDEMLPGGKGGMAGRFSRLRFVLNNP